MAVLCFYDMAFYLARSKNAAYRKEKRETCDTLVRFLQDNALTKRTLLRPEEPVHDEFRLTVSDLTEEGVRVLEAGFHPWLRGHERGMPVNDTTVLQKALASVRASAQGE